jgi:hypothetical protein
MLWVLSMFPVGVALWSLPSQGRTALWGAAIVLDTAHRLAPILTCWCHPGFRGVIYTIWNFYHFGMQNFGVLSLLRGSRSDRQRICDMTWTCGATVLAMLVTPGMVEFNHWITELGLCVRVARRAFLIVIALLAFGATSLFWMIPTPFGMIMWVIPVLVSAHMGLGMWHFLQDRWMWKLSDPQVRAIIRRDLLPPLKRDIYE